MNCQSNSSNSSNDKLELLREERRSAKTANLWLVQQAIVHLNSSDRQATVLYNHIIELLAKNEPVELVIQLIKTTPKTDTTLQWSLLYILGDIKDKGAAKWLSQYSIEQLPSRGQSCEGPRDGELLLRTMAVESLKRIAVKYNEISEYFLKIIASRPEREVLIEAIKAATELGLKEKVREMLPKEDHWMIDIRNAKIQEMYADPTRADTKEIGYIPPKKVEDYNTPLVKCACAKGGPNHG